VIVAALWLTRQSAPASIDAATVPRRLTTRMGNDTMPTIAPDGHAVAFVSSRSGRQEIYVVGTAAGSREIAITDDDGENLQPAWSPDGTLIAYHSGAHGGIWIVPSTGGVPRQVAPTGSEPAWNPDGTELVFTSGEGGMATQSSLWTVHVDGTGRRQLTNIGMPPGGHQEPSWCRTGAFVAFTVTDARGPRVWIVNADGSGSPRPILPLPSRNPVFGPGDRMLYWSSMTPGGSGQIEGVAIDLRSGSPVGKPAAIVPLNDEQGRLTSMSIASTGTVALGLETSDMNIWSVDATHHVPAPEPMRLTDDVVRDTHPDYSASGHIAYVQLNGRRFASWMMNEDGTNRQPVLVTPPVFGPQWVSSRNSRLLVTFFAEPSNWALGWVDTNTGQLTPTGMKGHKDLDLIEPRISPDGRDVAFHAIEPDGAMNVWLEAVEGGPERRLTSDKEAISFPVWSPDGRWLAVEIKRGEHTHVGMMPSAGGPVQQLTSEGGQSWPYSWSPDGEWIAYAGERNGIWNVYAVNRHTRDTRALTRFTSSSGYVRYPSWSPRGDRLAFERAIQSSGIWLARLPAFSN
jgi:Tol biopolymer transport system component